MVYSVLPQVLRKAFLFPANARQSVYASGACGKELETNRLAGFCFEETMPTGVYEHHKRVEYATYKCVICGKEVSRPPSQARQRTMRFCSKKCESFSRVKPELHISVTCEQCGKEYSKLKSQLKKKFCSKQCYAASMFRADALRRDKGHKNKLGRQYREGHAEQEKARARRYHEKNKEKILSKHKGRSEEEKNREKEYMRQYAIKNRKKINVLARLWNALNQDKKAINRIKRRSADKNGDLTLEQWENIKKKYNHTCLCCGRKEPEIQLTFDHVIPVSKGGISTSSNIQPLCFSCNRKKGAKTIDYR